MGALLAAADDPIALLGSTCEERASADYRARIRHDQEFVRMRGRRCEHLAIQTSGLRSRAR
jgi:hypothetical protein